MYRYRNGRCSSRTSCSSSSSMRFSCLQAGKHYPIPLWGPILLGTIAGCGGLFLPLDKGLQARAAL